MYQRDARAIERRLREIEERTKTPRLDWWMDSQNPPGKEGEEKPKNERNGDTDNERSGGR